MSILEDMDREFMERRPLPPGAAWLVGGNVWPALMADMTRRYRDNPGIAFDPAHPPAELFGAELRHCRRMVGWGLALAIDDRTDDAQTGGDDMRPRQEGARPARDQ